MAAARVILKLKLQVSCDTLIVHVERMLITRHIFRWVSRTGSAHHKDARAEEQEEQDEEEGEQLDSCWRIRAVGMYFYCLFVVPSVSYICCIFARRLTTCTTILLQTRFHVSTVRPLLRASSSIDRISQEVGRQRLQRRRFYFRP